MAVKKTGIKKKTAGKAAASKTKRTMKKTVSTKKPGKKPVSRRSTLTGRTRTVSESELFDLIQARAYELFLERGSMHGDDQYDWYRAQQEIITSVRLKKF